jgi:hypothetical protein
MVKLHVGGQRQKGQYTEMKKKKLLGAMESSERGTLK